MPELIKAIRGVKVQTKKKPRKYETHSYKWRRIRLAQLKREPLCKHCNDKGITTAGNTVDHISGDTWDNTPSNLMTLCIICHTKKTNKHDGGLGHAVNRTQGRGE